MDLSYAQNLEDWHLWLAFGGKSTGTYIDVGAGHPVADNVSFWFYVRGWQGLCVEPQPDLARLYSRIRPRDIVHEGLVGRTSGETSFHVVDRLHGFSTTVEEHARGAGKFGASFKTVTMPMRRLDELCERHRITDIDFLKIDVEGAEGDVLAGNDWQRFRPKVVVAEAIAPGTGEPNWSAWEPYLLDQGYRFRLFDSLNRFYVADECPDVFERIPAERAPWDAVKHMYEVGRAPENHQHPDHALSRDLARGLWACLPDLEPAMLARLVARAKNLDEAETLRFLDWFSTDGGRAALGRIACGYDGGQIHDD
jgi:FkbM family methyltransferase